MLTGRGLAAFHAHALRPPRLILGLIKARKRARTITASSVPYVETISAVREMNRFQPPPNYMADYKAESVSATPLPDRWRNNPGATSPTRQGPALLPPRRPPSLAVEV